MNFKQEKNISNSKYLEIFRNRAEVYVLFGGEPGTSRSRIEGQILANGIEIAAANPNQLATASAQVREEYLAVLYIKNSDPTRYGKRVNALKVTFVERSENDGDPYPSTLAKALEMLETWEEVNKASPPTQIVYDESGLAYNIEGDEQYNNHAGRGGRGRKDHFQTRRRIRKGITLDCK